MIIGVNILHCWAGPSVKPIFQWNDIFAFGMIGTCMHQYKHAYVFFYRSNDINLWLTVVICVSCGYCFQLSFCYVPKNVCINFNIFWKDWKTKMIWWKLFSAKAFKTVGAGRLKLVILDSNKTAQSIIRLSQVYRRLPYIIQDWCER